MYFLALSLKDGILKSECHKIRCLLTHDNLIVSTVVRTIFPSPSLVRNFVQRCPFSLDTRNAHVIESVLYRACVRTKGLIIILFQKGAF